MFDDERLCRGDVGGVRTELIICVGRSFGSSLAAVVGVVGGVLMALLSREGLEEVAMLFGVLLVEVWNEDGWLLK